MATIPSISIPTSNDLWLNVDSTHSVVSWQTFMYERHRKMMKSKKPIKKFNDVEKIKSEKKWRRLFFDFCEKNYNSEDHIGKEENDDFFSIFFKK